MKMKVVYRMNTIMTEIISKVNLYYALMHFKSTFQIQFIYFYQNVMAVG